MADQFNILDYTEGPILKTGQITDRTPAGRTTKDDGGFQRGIVGSKADAQYVILTTGQYASTTDITVNGKTDTHSNECVFDKVTGLMWSRTKSATVFGAGAEGLLWDGTAASDEDIFEYCDQANIAALSNFSDWRIPNRPELSSLFILASPATVANTTAFPVDLLSSGSLWSSTTRPDFITTAFRYTSLGFVNSQTKTTARFDVVLCRLGIEI